MNPVNSRLEAPFDDFSGLFQELVQAMRRFQFSLRSLLVSMTLAMVISGLLSPLSADVRPWAAALILAACILTVPFFLLAGLVVVAGRQCDD